MRNPWKSLRRKRRDPLVSLTVNALDPESVDWSAVAQRLRDELLKQRRDDDAPPAGIR